MEPPSFLFLQNTVIKELGEIERAEVEIKAKRSADSGKSSCGCSTYLLNSGIILFL
jgi:hypothetical protein